MDTDRAQTVRQVSLQAAHGMGEGLAGLGRHLQEEDPGVGDKGQEEGRSLVPLVHQGW